MDKRKLNKRVSSIDVAKAAGVSQSTVSRVFSDKANLISGETRDRVIKVANELGYRPSMIARSLSKKTTRIIGIEINDFNNSYYMEALALFTKSFQEKNYNLMIFNTENADTIEEKLSMALEYQVAGLILTNTTLDDSQRDWFEKYQSPVFMFNRISSETEYCNYVVGDNYAGGKAVGEFLVDHGFKLLAYVSGDRDTYTNEGRERGFMSAIGNSGCTVERIQGEFTYQAGFEAAKKLAAAQPTVEAVFCASDSIALGFIDGIRHCTDLRIPEDISVIGYDGISEGGNINYGLTTFRQPLRDTVERIVESMVRMIDLGKVELVQDKLQGEIILRESVRIRKV